jgi:hypothetical protein
MREKIGRKGTQIIDSCAAQERGAYEHGKSSRHKINQQIRISLLDAKPIKVVQDSKQLKYID